MDLSKIPELALRQKIKPINDRLDAIKAEKDRINAAEWEKLQAALAPLNEEALRLEVEIDKLLGEDRGVEGTCHITGLPIFSDDDTEEFTALACVVDDAKKQAA